ncbi:hypothetical protein AB205_0163960, partial [Aquarana catesbeiana]
CRKEEPISDAALKDFLERVTRCIISGTLIFWPDHSLHATLGLRRGLASVYMPYREDAFKGGGINQDATMIRIWKKLLKAQFSSVLFILGSTHSNFYEVLASSVQDILYAGYHAK